MIYSKKYLNKIVIFFIISFIFFDFITSLFYKLQICGFYRFSGVSKLLFEIYIVGSFFFSKIKKEFNLTALLLLLLLVVFFVIGQISIQQETEYKIIEEFLFGNIYFFNRYIYILIFFLFVSSNNIKETTWLKIYYYFQYILIINSILIFFGYLFHIEVFRSYEYSLRFGFSGFFSKPGEASYLYMSAIIVNYYLWHSFKKGKYLFLTILFCVSSLFLGQKKMYLFLLLLSLVFTYCKIKKLLLIGFPFVLCLLYYFRKELTCTLTKNFPFWERIYLEDGLLSTLTSYRNVLLEHAVLYCKENWTVINYFFGGISLSIYKVEFEFIDIYLFLGLGGVIYYMYIIYFLNKDSDNLIKTLIFIVFLISFFSGGLILNVTAIIMLYIAIKFITITNQKHKL